jgi:sugar phosphate isomerase/epimerase
LERLRRKMRSHLRSQGLLSFRILSTSSGRNLQPGDLLQPNQLNVTPVQALKNPKVLRDRGIKVIFSGFGDLLPTSEAVYKRLLDRWRSTWQKNLEEIQSENDVRVMLIHNRARAQARRELGVHLTQIFNNTPEEVLPVRIYQVLEELAAEPATHQLLPLETIHILRTVQDWMVPGDIDFPSYSSHTL